MNNAETIVRAYYAAFNAGDAAAFLALLTDDVVHDINQSGRETGKPAFATFTEQMRQSYREHVVDLVVFTEPTGRRAAAEFTVNGTYLQAAPGLPAARGQTYTLPVGAFFELTNGKIGRVSNYYNLSNWLAQVSRLTRPIAAWPLLRDCLRIRSAESAGAAFENRSGAYVEYVSTGSAERRIRRPAE